MHPAWSPDGDRIAFTSTRTGNAEIFVVEVESGEATQLTRSLADDRRPVWSAIMMSTACASTEP